LARLQLSKASLAHGLRCLLQRRLRLAAQPFLEVLEVTGGAFLELRFTAYPLRPRRLPQLLFARIALELLFGAHLGFTGGQRFGRTFAPRLGPLAFTLDEFGQRLLARLERANRLVPPLLEALALVPRSLAQGSLPLRQLRRRLRFAALLRGAADPRRPARGGDLRVVCDPKQHRRAGASRAPRAGRSSLRTSAVRVVRAPRPPDLSGRPRVRRTPSSPPRACARRRRVRRAPAPPAPATPTPRHPRPTWPPPAQTASLKRWIRPPPRGAHVRPARCLPRRAALGVPLPAGVRRPRPRAPPPLPARAARSASRVRRTRRPVCAAPHGGVLRRRARRAGVLRLQPSVRPPPASAARPPRARPPP